MALMLQKTDNRNIIYLVHGICYNSSSVCHRGCKKFRMAKEIQDTMLLPNNCDKKNKFGINKPLTVPDIRNGPEGIE